MPKATKTRVSQQQKFRKRLNRVVREMERYRRDDGYKLYKLYCCKKYFERLGGDCPHDAACVHDDDIENCCSLKRDLIDRIARVLRTHRGCILGTTGVEEWEESLDALCKLVLDDVCPRCLMVHV